MAVKRISNINIGKNTRFEDYTPDVLIEIANDKLKAEGLKATEEAQKKICEIIKKAHKQKTKTFGNAGYVEELIQNILGEYYSSEDNNDTIDVRHLQKFITADSSNSVKGLEELDKMIGLHSMKAALKKILNGIKADQRRAEAGLSSNKLLKLNFVFTGNPGTGKTTVAKKMGAILCGYGLLSSSDVIEVGRSMVIGKYQGHTASGVKELFDKATGKTLFIDEVYALCQGENDTFGKEAIDEIVRCLTDDTYTGKMAMVIAGYTNEVNDFIDKNTGMRSRFNHFSAFEDYTDEELWQILYKHATSENFQFEAGCDTKAIEWFAQQPRNKGFANGRLAADNLLPVLKSNMDSRISASDNNDIDFLTTILLQDFPDGFQNANMPQSALNPPTIEAPLMMTLLQQHAANETINNIINQSVGLIQAANGAGTGFLITENGYILTAAHVVGNETTFTFGLHGNTVLYKTNLAWINKTIDMAILKTDVSTQKFVPLELVAATEIPEQLTPVYLIGYPLGGALSDTPNITENTISGYQPKMQLDDVVQFDAIQAYNDATHGYSGGPLIRKSDLKVIGVLHGGLPNYGNINFFSDVRQLYQQKELIISK